MTIVLSYWNYRGFGSPIRYLLEYVGADWRERRYPIGPPPDYLKTEFTEDKTKFWLDFPNIPYLIDGDIKLTQSTTIMRYLGRKFKLYPKTELDQIRVELMEMESIDLRQHLMEVCSRGDYEMRRKNYIQQLPATLKKFSDFLGDRDFVAGDYLTYVDFILYDSLDFNRLFVNDCLKSTPNLENYLNRIEQLPKLCDYFESDRFTRFLLLGVDNLSN